MKQDPLFNPGVGSLAAGRYLDDLVTVVVTRRELMWLRKQTAALQARARECLVNPMARPSKRSEAQLRYDFAAALTEHLHGDWLRQRELDALLDGEHGAMRLELMQQARELLARANDSRTPENKAV